jgi:hypothetical protein
MPEHVQMHVKLITASSPARANSLANPDGVNGLPRSEAKTKGEADWRLSSGGARNSSPRREDVSRLAALARRTWMVPVSNSIDDHCRPRPRIPASRTEADQDHGRVAVAVAVALRGLDQALDFEFREVLAIAAHVTVAGPPQCDCP